MKARGTVLAVLVAFVVGGCTIVQPPAPRTTTSPALPPLPPPIKAAPKAMVASPAPQVWLYWTCPSNALPSYQYEVWHSVNLRLTNWTKLITVATNQIPVGGQQAEFFKVRTVDTNTGKCSDWGR